MKQPLLSLDFMLRISIPRPPLQGLKRPVVQQKVGACSPSTCYQLDVNYVTSPPSLAILKLGVGPVMFFSNFSIN